MTLAYTSPDERVRLHSGDCIEVMRAMPAESVDAIVTDPPYGLSFMNRNWDRFTGGGVDPAFGHWFAGFTDGEGCFSVHKKSVNGHVTYDCQFSISLRADDTPILEKIQRELGGIGTLARDRLKGEGNNQSRFCVSSKADCAALRLVFRMFPLRAKKAHDFVRWCEALDEWERHEPNEWAGMADARTRLMAGRKYDGSHVRADPFQLWVFQWGTEALRVLKPGGHIIAFGGTRTAHRLTSGLEDAGFEIRDSIAWLHGQGLPKSLDVSKAIDKHFGLERPRDVVPQGRSELHGSRPWMEDEDHRFQSNEPQCAGSAAYQGFGTALKPAWEPAVVGRKPLIGTVAQNVLAHGTGALNVDAGRILIKDGDPTVRFSEQGNGRVGSGGVYAGGYRGEMEPGDHPLSARHQAAGRWPPNVALGHTPDCREAGERRIPGVPPRPSSGSRLRQSGFHMTDGQGGYADADGYETVAVWDCAEGCPVAALDAQSGVSRPSGVASGPTLRGGSESVARGRFNGLPDGVPPAFHGDAGGASRFMYVAKADRAERRGSRHPTVKPLDLMRWLVRIVTPPGGIVLDPFAGSCSTLEAAYIEGMVAIGIDMDEASLRDVAARITQGMMVL